MREGSPPHTDSSARAPAPRPSPFRDRPRGRLLPYGFGNTGVVPASPRKSTATPYRCVSHIVPCASTPPRFILCRQILPRLKVREAQPYIALIPVQVRHRRRAPFFPCACPATAPAINPDRPSTPAIHFFRIVQFAIILRISQRLSSGACFHFTPGESPSASQTSQPKFHAQTFRIYPCALPLPQHLHRISVRRASGTNASRRCATITDSSEAVRRPAAGDQYGRTISAITPHHHRHRRHRALRWPQTARTRKRPRRRPQKASKTVSRASTKTQSPANPPTPSPLRSKTPSSPDHRPVKKRVPHVRQSFV